MTDNLKAALDWWNRKGFNGSLDQKSLGEYFFPNGFDDYESNVLHIYNEINKLKDEKVRPSNDNSSDTHRATIFKHVSGKYIAKQFDFNTYILVVNDDVLMSSVGFLPREIVTNTNDWKQL